MGLLSTYNRQFSDLTPFNLLFTCIVLGIAQQRHVKRQILYFVGVSIAGFIVEYLGVNYSLIFGSYVYGASLGIKLLEVPLIMGVNWVIVIYLACTIADRFPISQGWKIVLGPLLPVLLDLFIEPVAPKLNYWHWVEGVAPLKNFIAWYITSILFISIYFLLKIEIVNNNSVVVYIYYCVFFIIMNLFL